MLMTMRSFIDTDVGINLFDNAASARRTRARQLLQEEVSFSRAILSTQVIQEFFVTVPVNWPSTIVRRGGVRR